MKYIMRVLPVFTLFCLISSMGVGGADLSADNVDDKKRPSKPRTVYIGPTGVTMPQPVRIFLIV